MLVTQSPADKSEEVSAFVARFTFLLRKGRLLRR